jgi:hypothetical protein
MRKKLFWMAIFLLGVLTGASITSVLLGNQIDTLYIENRTLYDKLLVAGKQIEQLQESFKKKKRVISSISTQVEFVENNDFSDFEKNTIELNIEKNVREWLGILTGQDVEDIDYLLIPLIIDNREIELENKKIRLKVKLVVISETINVYIQAIPINKKK